MGKKQKQLSSEEQAERAAARRLANGIADGTSGGGGSGGGGGGGSGGGGGKAGGDKKGKGGGGAAAAEQAPAGKAGKGHKQRGAGAVMTSRGPVETRSGVVKKDWQRLPTQLLGEWCQREKRPRPSYNRARSGGGGRGGGKGGKGAATAAQENEEDYEEDWKKYHPDYQKQKEAAAEPTEFRQRVLLRDPKHDDRSLSFCPAQSSPTMELAREHAALLALLHVNADLPLERKLPDEFRDVWLQSKAAAAEGGGSGGGGSGGAKGAKGKAATSASSGGAATSNAVATASKDQSTPASGGASSSSSSSSGPSNATGVVSLSSDRRFASRAEARAASDKRTAESNEKRRRREALARANQDAPVYMSSSMRRILETALGISGGGGGGGGTGDAGASLIDLEEGSAERAAAEAAVKAGFAVDLAVHAVMVLRSSVNNDDDEDNNDSEKLGKSVLEWLCLHCREEDLPKGFSAEGKMIEVARTTFTAAPKPQQTPAPASQQQQLFSPPPQPPSRSPEMAPTFPYGFAAVDMRAVRAALSLADSAVAGIGLPLGGADAAALLVLCARVEELVAGSSGGASSLTAAAANGENNDDSDVDAESVANETMALESIYGEDSFSQTELLLPNDGSGSLGAASLLVLTVALESGPTVDVLLPKPEASPSAVSDAAGGGEGIEKKPSAGDDLESVVAATAAATEHIATRFAAATRHGYPRVAPAVLMRGASLATQVALAEKSHALWTEAVVEAAEAPSILYDLIDWVKDSASATGGSGSSWEVKPTAAANIGARPSLFLAAPAPTAASSAAATAAATPPAPTTVEKQTAADAESDASTRANPGTSKHQQHQQHQQHNRSPRRGGFWDSPAPIAPHAGSVRPPVPVPATMKRSREALPAFKSRREVLQLLENNQIILVSGGTGCGKTTQVPQFILEEASREAAEAAAAAAAGGGGGKRGGGRGSGSRSGGAVKIVVAQPRRIAAIGVASRVAEELGEKAAGLGIGQAGSRVGYMVRGDSRCDTGACQLLFCTTGVLLQRLRAEYGDLEHITHLVVDEVHERHLDADFLLAALKLILPRRPDLKVIMMSATLDQERFASYYGDLPNSASLVVGGGGERFAPYPKGLTPVVDIPGFAHPVTDLFLDDVADLTGYVPRNLRSQRAKAANQRQATVAENGNDDDHDDEDGGWSKDNDGSRPGGMDRFGGEAKQAKKGSELGGAWDVAAALDYRLITALVRKIVGDGLQGDGGSLLIFLPGVGEISRLCNDLTRPPRRNNGYDDEDGDDDGGGGGGGGGDGGASQFHVLPLHGALPSTEQSQVFGPAPRGKVKVVVATNIAETSITIPDCTVVIDSCRVKQTGFDPASSMPFLADSWAAQDALKQRRGRAGRVRSGCCYRLVTRRHYNSLPAHTTPEICRSPLEQLVLSVKANGYGSPQKFLATFLDAPAPDAVSAAVASLRAIDALRLAPPNGGGAAGGERGGGKGAEKKGGKGGAQGGGRGGGGLGSGGGAAGNRLSLTSLGGHLARLPCSPRIGKLLVFGALLGVLEPVLSIAATLSLRSPMLAPTQQQREERQRREREGSSSSSGGGGGELDADDYRLALQRKSRCGRSDHCFLAALSDAWQFESSSRGRRLLCSALGLSFVRMVEISQLRKQLAESLRSLGFSTAVPRYQHQRSGKTAGMSGLMADPTIVSLGDGYPAGSLSALARSIAEWRVVSAVLCAALWPNAVKIHKPVQKYQETSGGAVEKLAAAKELSFRVQRQVGSAATLSLSSSSPSSSSSSWSPPTTPGALYEERVWLHPSSLNFKENKFASPWLVYNECVVTSRPFIRDATEISAYAMLLFGGSIAVDIARGTLAVQTPAMIAAAAATATSSSSGGNVGGRSQSAGGFDRSDGSQWVRFSAVPRIGVLVNALRKRIDELLDEKINDPSRAIDKDQATLAAIRLLVTEGMG